MNGYRVHGPWDVRHHEHNARVAELHMDSEHYVRDLTARSINPATTTGAADNRQNGVHVVQLPDAGSPVVEWSILRPAQWLEGVVLTSIFYTHTATGQAAVGTLVARAHVTGTTALGVTGGLSDTLTFPAVTATAGELNVLESVVPLAVNQRHGLLGYRLTRNSANGSDGTANLLIVGVRMTYIPRRQEL